MKATEVRICQALEPGESYLDPTFLLVETTAASNGDTVTRIELASCRVVSGRERWQVATLGRGALLDHASALEWAVSFAASRNIPVVYERDELAPCTYAAAAHSADASRVSSAAK
jgi:hypothetical protein